MLNLHVEVRGEGPALVLVPGGGGDAGMYAEVAPLLAQDHAVITYDRRGNSRSPLPSPHCPIDVATQADDVIALLDRLDIRRAAIFGSSGGAIITLDLLARYPERLTAAVAHEPPLMSILESDSLERRALEGIHRLGVRRGPLRAFAAFGAMTMPDPPWLFRSAPGQALIAFASQVATSGGHAWRTITGRQPGTMARILSNVELLIRRELPEFCDYTSDIDALRTSQVPWATAVGLESHGRPYFRPAYALAGQAEVECVEFPGGHTIYMQNPRVFMERLNRLLKELQTCREQD